MVLILYRKLNYSFGGLLVAYSLFIIIFYRKDPVVLFNGISVTLLLVFLYNIGIFLSLYLNRMENLDRQIEIITKTVLPTLKYTCQGDNIGSVKYSN